jgi:hypothetical protein
MKPTPRFSDCWEIYTKPAICCVPIDGEFGRRKLKTPAPKAAPETGKFKLGATAAVVVTLAGLKVSLNRAVRCVRRYRKMAAAETAQWRQRSSMDTASQTLVTGPERDNASLRVLRQFRA